MELICVTQRKELVEALKECTGAKMHHVENVFDCMEILNFDIPDAVIIDVSGSKILDLDMIEMFPPHGSEEHIPIIGIVPPTTPRAPETAHINYFVNDITDLERVVERVFALLHP